MWGFAQWSVSQPHDVRLLKVIPHFKADAQGFLKLVGISTHYDHEGHYDRLKSFSTADSQKCQNDQKKGHPSTNYNVAIHNPQAYDQY